jgi:exonuclease III
MTDDPTQGFLFGNLDVVDDDVARHELRLLALNIQSPSITRARDQLDWFYRSKRNVLVLTEVKVGESSDLLIKDLDSSGYTVAKPRTGPDDRYMTLIATKGYAVQPVQLRMDSPRFIGARLCTHLGDLDILGLYAPTNGMSEESSRNRRAFQQRVLAAVRARLDAEPAVPLLITGDFNILEPGHVPAASRALFEEHDFEFYRTLAAFGLVDAFRKTHPEATDLTWYGPQGGQRLDHVFLSPAVFPNVSAVGFDHDVRTSRLSDHSALTLALA